MAALAKSMNEKIRSQVPRAPFLLALVALALFGCSSGVTRVHIDPPSPASEHPNKATVIFYRPGLYGGDARSSLFDLSTEPPTLIGILIARTKVAYLTDPGVKRFMVVGEKAEVIDANLAGGKKYYVRVTSHMGWAKARFAMKAEKRSDPIDQVEHELADCGWTTTIPASYAWAQAHMRSIEAKRDNAISEYLASGGRPGLTPEDGH